MLHKAETEHIFTVQQIPLRIMVLSCANMAGANMLPEHRNITRANEKQNTQSCEETNRLNEDLKASVTELSLGKMLKLKRGF